MTSQTNAPSLCRWKPKRHDENELTPVAAAVLQNSHESSPSTSPDEKKHCNDDGALAMVADNSCVCSRPKGRVTCSNCGHVLLHNRKERQCPQHVNYRYLNDINKCPKCLSDNLAEG